MIKCFEENIKYHFWILNWAFTVFIIMGVFRKTLWTLSNGGELLGFFPDLHVSRMSATLPLISPRGHNWPAHQMGCVYVRTERRWVSGVAGDPRGCGDGSAAPAVRSHNGQDGGRKHLWVFSKEHLHGIWALIQKLFSMHTVRTDLWGILHHGLLTYKTHSHSVFISFDDSRLKEYSGFSISLTSFVYHKYVEIS